MPIYKYSALDNSYVPNVNEEPESLALDITFFNQWIWLDSKVDALKASWYQVLGFSNESDACPGDFGRESAGFL